MKTVRPEHTARDFCWEKESGFLTFLSSVPSETEKFEDATGFGLRYIARPPESIDGRHSPVRDLGFLVLRENRLIPGRTYCLYTLLAGRTLCGFIGICREGSITTCRELKPLDDFPEGKRILYDWLRALVRHSCDK